MSGTCIKCGASLGDFDAGGDMVCDGCEARGSGHGGGNTAPCQRCGRIASELYASQGMLLCPSCHFSDGGPAAGGGRPSRFGQIITFIGRKLRIIPAKQKPQQEAGDPRPQMIKEEKVFNVSSRQMVEKPSAIESAHPLSEKHHGEKKPQPGARKFFLALKKDTDEKK